MSDHAPVSKITITQNMALFPVVELALRTLGVRRTWSLLAAFAGSSETPTEPAVIARKQLSHLKRSRQLAPVKGRCLSRSLILWWQLRRRGIHTTLYVGVRHKKWLHAHAWLQIDDRVLNAGKLVHSKYTTLATFNHPGEMP